MPNKIENLDILEDKIHNTPFNSLPLGVVFSDLNVYLTEHTENREVRERSEKLMETFLERLAKWLNEAPRNSLPLPTIFGVLMTIISEAGQYRHETYVKQETEDEREWLNEIREEILPNMKKLRERAVDVTKFYFEREEFDELEGYIKEEILPLLDAIVDRYIPFRVIQIGRIADRLYNFRERIEDERLRKLLEQIYEMKYPRFGTSGLRGLWDRDFTERKAKIVTQAICDNIKRENLEDKVVIIGYDSRLHADEVADWVAQVCVANGIKVFLADRDTPTPTLGYWAIERIGEKNVAGILNCTASHNPIEWQGIKYSPQNGCPAPTLVTDWIAARANRLQLINIELPSINLDLAEKQGKVKKFDPLREYSEWLLLKEKNLRTDMIKNYFIDKVVVIDEMHGAGRGYFKQIFDKLNIKYKLVHGWRDPRLGNLEYANPEEPFLTECIQKVKDTKATLGLALDTDADRYGVVAEDGTYFRPNQIMALLTDYLIRYKRYKGKVIRTVTTSLAVDKVARENKKNVTAPDKNVVPAYIEHPFYELNVGKKESVINLPVYVVMVGIKYVIEGMQANLFYQVPIEPDPKYRESIIIGGEESGSFTSKGHLPDKDGIWAGLNIMEMVAAHKKPLSQIWDDFMEKYGRVHSHRVDVDACDEAKDRLIDFYLCPPSEELKKRKIGGLKIVYLGGVRYDLVEMTLEDEETKKQSRLIIRASGTEPLSRIYTESESEEIRKNLEIEALRTLEEISAEMISRADSSWRLVEILVVTEASEQLMKEVLKKIDGISLNEVLYMLEKRKNTLEQRNKKIANKWLAMLKNTKS